MDALGRPAHVAVLGGTSDIGLAVVRRAGPRRVTLAGRDTSACKEAGRDLPGLRVVELDVTDRPRLAGAVDEVFADGDVDLVVVAAGVLGDQQRAEEDPTGAAWELLETSGVGPSVATLAAARHLRRQGHGHLLVLSSVAAVRPRPSNFVYGAAKAQLDAVALGLRSSLEGTGVGVTVVRPGFVRTSMTQGLEEAPFAADPHEVAEAALAGVAAGRAVVYPSVGVRAVASALRVLPAALVRRLDAG